MRASPVLPTLLLCTLLTSGVHAAGLPDAGGETQSVAPIVNGTPAIDIPEHRAAVALHVVLRNGGQVSVSAPFCTGTLISDTVVLTAAHCVEENPATGLPPLPNELLVYVGDDPATDRNLAQNLYQVNEIAVHPGYDPTFIINDIAVVVLEQPAPVAPIPPLPRVIGITDADIGARLNFAGFGQDENEDSGRKLQTDGAVGGMGCAVNGCPALGDTNTQISYAMEETGPCFGDSGGPAFLYRGNRPYVAGVTSYGDEDCSLYGVSTRVDAYIEWLSEYTGVDTAPPTVSIVSPGEADVLAPGFTVMVSASDEESVVRVDLYVDNELVQSRMSEPWVFGMDPALPLGEHDIQVVAYDSANSAAATISVLVDEDAASGGEGGGCSATGREGGGATFALLALAILLAVRRRPGQALA